MRKVLLLGLTLFGTVALTGCDAISGLFSGEKQYKYDDFKALLADRKLSFTATRATSVLEENGVKTSVEYTYSALNGEWEGTRKEGGIRLKTLDIVNEVKSYDILAALADKKVDDIYGFYAKEKSYRITLKVEYKENGVNIRGEAEYKYGEDGLKTYSHEKKTDLDAVETTEEKETFEYFDK